MRKMKDSGIEWIGEIPESWEVCKIKHFAEGEDGVKIGPFGSALTNRLINDGDYNVYSQANLIGADFSKTNHTINEETFAQLNNYEVLPGDICVSMMGTIGKCKVVPDGIKQGIMDSHLIKIRLDSTVNPKFFEYVYDKDNSGVCFVQMKMESKGSIMDGLNSKIVKNLLFPLPPIEEQDFIVKYLEEKCGKIDSLIAVKEKSNALLKEQRQSIIYEAVTKGLNSDVPMKYSGIEWIGDVPETWDVKKIKYCFDLVAGATPKSSNSEYWDGNIVWITPADYKTEDVFIEKGHKNITDEGMQSCATTLIPENCIIFSKRAPVGLVAINRVPLCTNQGCISCIPHNDISSKFYYYVMSVFTEQFELFASGTTFKEISADSFANFLLPNTTFDEQVEIVNYLDEKCAELDTIIKSNRTIIEKLKEYRKSIIFEAVTGKAEI
ncbi:MAG: restriction endonuclease subunit S [Clostridia bacterium]|nr:restriction endonuclease subunit S [Clostridia bacterium]